MADAILEGRGLSKRFGGIAANSAIDFALMPRELHAVIGPNGGGKTTFLSTLFGELMPDSGQVLLNGTDVTRLSVPERVRRGLARSYQVTSVFPGFSVLENLAFGIRARTRTASRMWRKAVLDDNHEIKMARSEAERRDWLAKRARMDRFADPTLDLRTFQERGGHETGFGIGFSVPIGGALRSAASDQTAAEAIAASVAAHRVQRDVEIIAERDVIGAQQGLEAWRQNQAAAQSSTAMLARMQRAHELGDQGITELLIARRQDYDMRRNEARTRAAAHGAVLQLLIDSHRVWGLGDEE